MPGKRSNYSPLVWIGFVFGLFCALILGDS